ncbi:MAG: hypothetical protein RLZZ387_1404 [Chloroflexota bacterium]|jgi:aminoglycoside phosphotransferase (APT) family kinase protein
MISAVDDKLFGQLLRRIDPALRLLRAWPLAGGVSAQVMGIEYITADGCTGRLVVRRHGDADRARNPRIAADEYALLQRLHAAGLAVPAPRHLDESGELFPDPVLVIEHVEGTSDFAATPGQIAQLAAQLAAIHGLDVARLDVAFLPRQAEIVARQLRARPASTHLQTVEGRVWDLLERAWPVVQRNPPALLHGDYWPGNMLWRDGRLAAVIDWEDAAVGDPLADVANCRLELLWAGGAEAAELFTRHYCSLAPLDTAELPYWELCAALRPLRNMSSWGLDAEAERAMRAALEMCVLQALARLGAE